eukprot:940045-Amphidinium_carterae.1
MVSTNGFFFYLFENLCCVLKGIGTQSFLLCVKSFPRMQEIDRDMLVKGLRLKKDLGYSKEEVKQFRDLFNMYDKAV